jgi:hypothetical protein
MVISQSMETTDSIPFAGKTVTYSFYARAGANYSAASNSLVAYVVTGTGTDQNQRSGYTGQALPIQQGATLTTTWQRFSFTGTVSTATKEIAFLLEAVPVGTAGANDYFEATGIQLDIGSVALPFRTNGSTIQRELAACQRYFTSNAFNSHGFSGFADSTTSFLATGQFPVEMRTAPSNSPAATAADFEVRRAGVTSSAVTAIASTNSTATGVRITATTGATLTAGAGGILTSSSGTKYLYWSAEL